MDDAEFDRFMARAANPNLIPGIYNYCDRRCDRCRFSERCLSHIESQEAEAQPDDGEAPTIGTMVGRSLTRALDMVKIIARRQGIDLTTTAEERVQQARAAETLEQRALSDPAVALSRRYAMTTWPITRALWPVVMARGDDAVIDALETIERLCTSVASKTYRAVRGMVEPDFDPTDLQSDPNGSAKVARLLTDESRRAWRVLMQTGRATANGVPAQLVRLLDELDAELAARFPRAMEFMRPGFDTEAPSRPAEGDRAPTFAALPEGHA